MESTKPIIGITECYNYEYYEYAIKKHGEEVKLLTISDDLSDIKFDGLLLPGGGDIDPELYGEKRHPKTKYVNRQKDDFEILLFNKAIDQDIPVLGICRGIQIMNLAMGGRAMGGSLYQHISDHIPEVIPALFPDFPIHKDEVNRVDTKHDIKISTGSRLSQIIGESGTVVNSSHHQAVKVISDYLVVTAQSKDGIIEALEDPARPFVIGVQYHLERMWKDATSPLYEREFLEHATKLFKAFIKAASEESNS